ncbi:TIGR03086 family metal-binding protein [Streptomyces sp. ODS28]|uniref:TIGR03086 family metal-binding protein n=1 Tax=Streptomyces sp. ODS28 TaxID=3136688 RepID=UPI0031E8033A
MTAEKTIGEATVAAVAADPRPQLARAVRQMAEVVAGVRAEDLGRPTPCAEYDVRGLLAHIIGGTHAWAELGETGRDKEIAHEGYEQEPEGGWAGAYEEAYARFEAAWADDAKLDRVVVVPWGTMPGRAALAGDLMEIVTHSWDLARSIGHTGALDQELGEAALSAARRALPTERRGEGVPFDAARTAPEGADAYGRLAAWLGRPADWTAA